MVSADGERYCGNFQSIFMNELGETGDGRGLEEFCCSGEGLPVWQGGYVKK